MLGARHRFHGYGSLRSVYQHGKTARGQTLNLKFNRRDSKRPYRVAVVVSRKVSKSAVKRNRIRRRLYEQVRHSPVDIAAGTDLVFTVFDEKLVEMSPAKLQDQIDRLLSQVTT